MQKLYVIGNGFDLHHGLDTRYRTFGFFLKNRYPTIYDHLIEYYGFSDLDINNRRQFGDILWNEFEKSLALLDSDTVLEAHSDSIAKPGAPDFRDRDWNTFEIDIELIVEELTVNLFKGFKEFILNVEYPAQTEEQKISLDHNAQFLTFNYTDTLERYYKVPRKNILYIHDKADESNNSLILGHGINPETFELEEIKPPEGMNGEELEEWENQMADSYDHSYELGKNRLLDYFSGTFKPTMSIINDNRNYFYDLKNIKEIVILGHSLSEVDSPYIEKIYNSVGNAKWTVTYYSENERKSHNKTLINLGVEAHNINLITINELA